MILNPVPIKVHVRKKNTKEAFFPCVICKLSTEDRASGTAGSECTVSVYIRYIGVVIAGHMRWLAVVE